jgi:hypothetical protein
LCWQRTLKEDGGSIVKYIPSNDIEQTEHARPLPRARLAEIREVFEVVGCDVAVDGEFAVRC